jgi:trigger factor
LKVEYTEESSVRKALQFEIDADVVDKEIETRARDYARKARIPGFRPGKIPVDVIKRRFKQQVLEEVAESLVNKYVGDELESRGFRPLASPQVTDLKIDEKQPLTFKAVFETLPVVEVPNYQGLAVKVKKVDVPEEAIDAEVDRMREEAARYDPVEGRATREGDFVILDLNWKPADGAKGGREENALMEVGSSDNHADLNAALVALSPGDTKRVTVAYPADHPTQGLAGRTIEYDFTLKSIKDKVVPAADDEFAKDLGEFGSLAEVREKIRERLRAQDQLRFDRDVKGALVDELLLRASFEVPEALVARHMDARLENAARTLAMQGIDPRQMEVDWRAYREAQREDATKGAKADILLDEIGRREKIEATDAEVDAEVARLAEGMRRPVEAVRAKMEKDGDIHGVRARIREDRVLDLIRSGARIEAE